MCTRGYGGIWVLLIQADSEGVGKPRSCHRHGLLCEHQFKVPLSTRGTLHAVRYVHNGVVNPTSSPALLFLYLSVLQEAHLGQTALGRSTQLYVLLSQIIMCTCAHRAGKYSEDLLHQREEYRRRIGCTVTDMRKGDRDRVTEGLKDMTIPLNVPLEQ